jgi:hypothetical protein
LLQALVVTVAFVCLLSLHSLLDLVLLTIDKPFEGAEEIKRVRPALFPTNPAAYSLLNLLGRLSLSLCLLPCKKFLALGCLLFLLTFRMLLGSLLQNTLAADLSRPPTSFAALAKYAHTRSLARTSSMAFSASLRRCLIASSSDRASLICQIGRAHV